MATADGGYLRFVLGQDGEPVPSGQLLVSPAGSTTPSPLFSDQAMTVAATNPLIADGTGFIPSFYLTIGRYDYRYYDAEGTLLYTVENVNILDYEEVTDLTLDLTTAQADILELQTQMGTVGNENFLKLTGGTVTGGTSFTQRIESDSGYRCRRGTAGPFTANTFNISWDGTNVGLWIDDTLVGAVDFK